MISLIAAGLCLHPQATLTLEHSAIRVDRLLDRIGGLSGQTLECTDPFLSDYVVLRVQQEPVDSVLSKLAETVEGRWVPIDGGQKLVVDEAAVEARRRAFWDREVDFFRRGLARAEMTPNYDEAYIKSLLGKLTSSALPEDYAARQKALQPYRYESPVERLKATLANLIGPEALGKLEAGDRVVYSNRPTSLQRQLPPGGMEAIQRYLQELQALDHVRGQMTEEVRNDNRIAGFFQYYEIPENQTALAHVRVDRHPHAVYISVETFDAEGKPVIRGTYGSITPHYMDALPMRNYELDPRLEGEIVYTPEAAEWNGHIQWNVAKNPEPTELIRHAISGSGGRDILGFSCSETVLAAAKKLDRNLVALLPDFATHLYWEGPSTQSLQNQFFMLVNSYDAAYRVEDDWLIVQPKYPDLARSGRISRDLLGKAAQEIERTKELPVATMLALLANANTDRDVSDRFLLIRPFLGGGLRRSTLSGDSKPLLFIAKLAPEVRRKLLNEGTVSFDFERLPDDAKNQLSKLINSFAYIEDKTQASPNDIAYSSSDYDGRIVSGRQSPLREPTVALAQREAWPATVEVSMIRDDTFVVQTPSIAESGSRASLQTIAAIEALNQFEAGNPNAPVRRHSLYAYEPVARFEIKVHFGNRFLFQTNTYLNLRPGQGEYMGIGEFSGELKRKFDKLVGQELARLRGGGE